MNTNLSYSDEEISDHECDLGEQTLSVNTVDVHLEISSMYRASLERKPEVLREYSFKVQANPVLPSEPRPILRRKKAVSFYLPDIAPYIFYPYEIKD